MSARVIRPRKILMLSCMAVAVAVDSLPASAQGRRPKPEAPVNVKSLDDKAASLDSSGSRLGRLQLQSFAPPGGAMSRPH